MDVNVSETEAAAAESVLTLAIFGLALVTRTLTVFVGSVPRDTENVSPTVESSSDTVTRIGKGSYLSSDPPCRCRLISTSFSAVTP